ncbi:MAG: sigma-70 family RNA polymerase sigma factor [Dehalococcoidia bacterium]
MEEQDLISRSKEGDVQAFNELVERYERLVYNVVLRMMGDSAAAEDVTQDTFVSAYKAIGKFRGGNFKSWLLRIATNNCRDRFRSAQRSRAMSLDALMLQSEPPSLADDSESPEDHALRRELGQALNEGLRSLPPDQRLIVVLCDIQELSYEEASEAAGCSLGTVKSRLNRGRTRLRDFMLTRRELLPAEFRL